MSVLSVIPETELSGDPRSLEHSVAGLPRSDTANSDGLRYQLHVAMSDTMELAPQIHVQDQTMRREIALDGVSIGILMWGAMVATAPGAHTASATCTTAKSGLKALCRAVKDVTHLFGARRAVHTGYKEGALSVDWVEVSPQSANGAQ
ncbi:hypothetical protein RHS03_01353, partial [Rhizoctonia solani]